MNTAPHTQARLAFHGCVVLLLGLLGGIGFSYAAAVADTSSELYRVWKFVHLEGIINGILVLATAGIWHTLREEQTAVKVGRWTLLVGAYCNAIGPWLTALFIGHRVIQPHTPLEAFVVYGFYIPGTLPLISFALFAWVLGRSPAKA